MPEQDDKYDFANSVLGNIFGQQHKLDLWAAFEKTLVERDMSQRAALAELDIVYRTLIGILDASQKQVDLLVLQRFADFIKQPVEKVFLTLLEKVEQNFNSKIGDVDAKEFIIRNFDLRALKKYGYIDSVTDFVHIEERIKEYFGLKSIYDYGKEFINIAYSSGKRQSKDNFMKNWWGESATRKLKRINNPHEYDRDGLIEYIPSIRWHSTDPRKGLFQVVREIYRFGVTVIYEPYLTTVYVRGATLPVNDKPCIVLTNYTNYYPSLWFALMHELHHVLFDWEVIRHKPHLSSEIDKFDKSEVEADEFAREYLFSKEKMKVVSPQIRNETFVNHYAKAFDVHPSIIYAFYCWDNADSGQDVFKRFSKHLLTANETLATLDPDATFSASKKAPVPTKPIPVKAKAKQLSAVLYNGL